MLTKILIKINLIQLVHSSQLLVVAVLKNKIRKKKQSKMPNSNSNNKNKRKKHKKRKKPNNEERLLSNRNWTRILKAKISSRTILQSTSTIILKFKLIKWIKKAKKYFKMMQNKSMMSNFKWRFNKQFYLKMLHFLDWMTLVSINSKLDVFLPIKKLLPRNQNMFNSSEMSHMKVQEFQSEVAPEEHQSLQAPRTIRMTNCFQILILSSLR